MGSTYTASSGYLPPASVPEDHPVMSGAVSKDILISYMTEISSYGNMMPILQANGVTVGAASVKESNAPSAVVFGFGLDFSDLALRAEFPLIMSNIIDYYIFSDTDREGAVGGELDQPSYPPNSFMSDLVLNGATYYREVLEEYKDLLDYTLDQREGYLTDSQIALIRMYFNLL